MLGADVPDAFISIHAPTRGATGVAVFPHVIFEFQSTLPREERQPRTKSLSQAMYFNPRSHERSDSPVSGFFNSSTVFQSTLPREERPGQPTLPLPDNYFNPRSHERSDNARSVSCTHFIISIHAPTRGATSHTHCQDFSHRIFQSTLPREERRPARPRPNHRGGHFNPRSHERSDLVFRP